MHRQHAARALAVKVAIISPLLVEYTTAFLLVAPTAKWRSSRDTAIAITVSPTSRSSFAAPAHAPGGEAAWRVLLRRLCFVRVKSELMLLTEKLPLQSTIAALAAGFDCKLLCDASIPRSAMVAIEGRRARVVGLFSMTAFVTRLHLFRGIEGLAGLSSGVTRTGCISLFSATQATQQMKPTHQQRVLFCGRWSRRSLELDEPCNARAARLLASDAACPRC